MENTEQLQEFLLQEWFSGLRLTTIPQALERLGMGDDVNLRWSVGKRLERRWRDTLTSPEKRRGIAEALGRTLDEVRDEQWREQVRTWNLASILLRDEEKLVARAIMVRQREAQGFPHPHDITRMLGLKIREVHQAIRMLARLGFLSLPDGRRPALYALADGHERFLEGLGFFFHTVTLDTGERFGVPWAVDFLLLVSSAYNQHRVSLDDACAHCVDRIHIEVDRGKLAEVMPGETIVYRGETWGQNNLFRSEEHLKEWSGGSLPEAPRWTSVGQFLAQAG